MIVLDASAVVDWLVQTSAGLRIESRIFSYQETLHAPQLLDLEVTQVLRRLVLLGIVSKAVQARRSESDGSSD
jgi:predicted nucleic acid-binding protein